MGSNLVETPQELEARTTWFITQRIPHYVWITGYIVFAVLAIGLVPQVHLRSLWSLAVCRRFIVIALLGFSTWSTACTGHRGCPLGIRKPPGVPPGHKESTGGGPRGQGIYWGCPPHWVRVISYVVFAVLAANLLAHLGCTPCECRQASY